VGTEAAGAAAAGAGCGALLGRHPGIENRDISATQIASETFRRNGGMVSPLTKVGGAEESLDWIPRHSSRVHLGGESLFIRRLNARGGPGKLIPEGRA
jgi:hypothetical protein